MGNCPSGFQVNPAQGTTCVAQCPDNKGFETAVVDGMPACRYKNDKTVFVKLMSVQGVPASGNNSSAPLSLDDIRRKNPQLYNQYKQAQENFDKEFPVAYSKIEKQRRIADAFNDLQAAENVRDQSPQAYQDARIRYYTLVKGNGWVDEEKQRITTSEVVPKIAQYMASYEDMNTRITQQQQTLDVVNNVTDRVISMKDEFAFATNTFSKQIGELKNQINIERKNRKEENQSWIDFLLNILVVVAGIAAIIVLARKMLFSDKSFQSAYTQRSYY